MITPDTTSYQLEIYTGVTCWRGAVNYASARRLTDLLNDSGHGYIELERSNLVTWDGHLPRTVDTFGTISINKKNAIVVLCHGCPTDTSANGVERVSKIAQRVAVYAPPIAIIGNLYTADGANLITFLDFSHQAFVPLTSAEVRRMDGKSPLPALRGLALINRQAIAAIQVVPLGEPENEGESLAPQA